MRFRLLSWITAIVLLSGALGANLVPGVSYTNGARLCLAQGGRLSNFSFGPATWSVSYGWPLTVREFWASGNLDDFSYSTGVGIPSGVQLTPDFNGWHWDRLTLNSGIGLAIAIAGLLACEFILRRYAPRPKVE